MKTMTANYEVRIGGEWRRCSIARELATASNGLLADSSPWLEYRLRID